jgi:hypothetical protein
MFKISLTRRGVAAGRGKNQDGRGFDRTERAVAVVGGEGLAWFSSHRLAAESVAVVRKIRTALTKN